MEQELVFSLASAAGGPSLTEMVSGFIHNPGVFVPFMGIMVAIVAIVFGCLKKTIVSVSRERTKREIAAYVAEGSMTPEQGERLLRARPKGED